MYLISSCLCTLYKLNLNYFVDVLNPYMVYLCFELFFVHNAIDLHISPSKGQLQKLSGLYQQRSQGFFELGLEERGGFIVNTLVNSAVGSCRFLDWTRICKRLRRPGIDSEDSIPPVYVAWRAGC